MAEVVNAARLEIVTDLIERGLDPLGDGNYYGVILLLRLFDVLKETFDL